MSTTQALLDALKQGDALIAFRAEFLGVHRREPSSQEIWDAAARTAQPDKDAERYRWIKARAYKDGATLSLEVAVIDDMAIGDFGSFIDDTIDAAIAASKSNGGDQ